MIKWSSAKPSEGAERLMGFCIKCGIPKSVALLALERNWKQFFDESNIRHLYDFFLEYLPENSNMTYVIYPD